MRRSIATLCMSGTLRDKLEAAAAARFDAVELCEPDFIGFRGTALEVRNIADDLGIGIDLYQPSHDIGGGAEPASQPGLDRAERNFDMLSSGEDAEDLREIPGNRIFFVRIGDARRPGWDGGRAGWDRNFPGQGELDMMGFLEHVLLTGYAGTISLASFSDLLRATPSRRTGIDAMRSLLFLESQVRGRLEQARSVPGSAATAGRTLDTVSL